MSLATLGGHAAAVQESSEAGGAETLDAAGARQAIPVVMHDSLPALLLRLDHDELVYELSSYTHISHLSTGFS